MTVIHLLDANAVFRTAAESGGPFWLRQVISEINRRDFCGEITVAVWDSLGANNYRRKWVPTYKTNRTPMDTNIFEGLKVCRALIEQTRALSISIPEHEADDIIAALVERYKGTHPIKIHTIDRDLLSLCVHQGVTATVAPMEGIRNEDIFAFKCLVGDPSDRIAGCPGFGRTAWDSISSISASQLVQHVDNEAMFERVVRTLPDKLHKRLLAGREIISASKKAVTFRPIAPNQLDAHMKLGTNEPDKIEAYFKRFML